MRDNGIIKSIQKDSKKYFWILDPEYPNKEPITFFSYEKKVKIVEERYPSRGPYGVMIIIGIILVVASVPLFVLFFPVAIILLIVGFLLFYYGLSMS